MHKNYYNIRCADESDRAKKKLVGITAPLVPGHDVKVPHALNARQVSLSQAGKARG